MPSTAATSVRSDYVISIADTQEEIRAAQRLRHRVLADEPGEDGFDERADHLIVTHTTTGDVVGTCRLLPPGRTGLSRADAAFDLSSLRAVRPLTVEADRCCVHPDHRRGAVLHLLWSGLARYLLLSGRRYLAARACVPLADGGRAAAVAWRLGATEYAAPAAHRVRPHRPWTPPGPAEGVPDRTLLPPLLRGCLRLGARVCGPPAHDPHSDTADFFVLLDLDRLDDRHRRHLLGETR
ncbi:GNAT family N-acetyltransferase [Streptomyces sp. 4F14]|uniref:GNAT family N-acetyltransferase n=1 Tax=Streptomyces sp. 4F14 TaxID=3394380 RepID=UPI003A8958FE